MEHRSDLRGRSTTGAKCPWRYDYGSVLRPALSVISPLLLAIEDVSYARPPIVESEYQLGAA